MARRAGGLPKGESEEAIRLVGQAFAELGVNASNHQVLRQLSMEPGWLEYALHSTSEGRRKLIERHRPKSVPVPHYLPDGTLGGHWAFGPRLGVFKPIGPDAAGFRDLRTESVSESTTRTSRTSPALQPSMAAKDAGTVKTTLDPRWRSRRRKAKRVPRRR